MTDAVKAVLLGIVEGVTEFLPISSTGHMIVVGHWLEFPQPLAKTFDIFIQFGAILAVVVYFRARIQKMIASFDSRNPMTQVPTRVMIAFLPAAFVGLATHHWIEAHLETPTVVALSLIAGGIAIEIVERIFTAPRPMELEDVSTRLALAVGFYQCLALIPGVSRSAATIMGGLTLGLPLSVAAEFSFFLAIPTMAAASGYSLLKAWGTLSIADLQLLAIGFVVAFFVAWAVVAGFMRYIQTHSFRVFAIYRILVGALLLLLEYR